MSEQYHENEYFIIRVFIRDVGWFFRVVRYEHSEYLSFVSALSARAKGEKQLGGQDSGSEPRKIFEIMLSQNAQE